MQDLIKSRFPPTLLSCKQDSLGVALSPVSSIKSLAAVAKCPLASAYLRSKLRSCRHNHARHQGCYKHTVHNSQMNPSSLQICTALCISALCEDTKEMWSMMTAARWHRPAEGENTVHFFDMDFMEVHFVPQLGVFPPEYSWLPHFH